MAKLFGNTGGRHVSGSRAARPTLRLPVRPWLKVAACTLAVLVALYAMVVWAPIRPLEKLRNLYIETALSTMRHQWLATAFFPDQVVEDVRQQMREVILGQEDLNSQWNTDTPPRPEEKSPVTNPTPAPAPQPHEPLPSDRSDEAMEAFFSCFHELDREETLDWVKTRPELLTDGWGALKVNEAGPEDDGLPIHTQQGHQVLAIDAQNQILLVRVKGTGYRGVLAIAKDPTRLSLQASANIGETGQNAGTIAAAHNGLLAMTASGFQDMDGHGKGGEVTGFALCDGVAMGDHLRSGYKRLEKHSDNLLYIKDAGAAVSADATDAMEFTPALIVDGKIVVDDTCGWTGVNPRACLGQSDRYEILMLVIEGRLPTVSLGVSVVTCAEILAEYGGMQAMNMDGGTSAILWYDGEYVTLCSNTALPAGRLLPNVWVYS